MKKDCMKKGGKVKKKEVKVDGMKAKGRLDKPARKATGGAVSAPMKLDTDDDGVSSAAPFAKDAPMHKKGGKVKK